MPVKGMGNVKAAIKQIAQDKNDDLRIAIIKGFRAIQMETPHDDGTARANWFLSETTPSNEVTDSTMPRNEFADIPEQVFGKKTLFTNNKPYIETLEYGGYPNPPKLGTKLKDGTFEIRSVGGFSKLAPDGWVRKALLKMARNIREL